MTYLRDTRKISFWECDMMSLLLRFRNKVLFKNKTDHSFQNRVRNSIKHEIYWSWYILTKFYMEVHNINTYLYLYRLSPWSGWTGFLLSKYSISLFMLLIEEDTLGFDWGKGPKYYSEKRPVCRRFSTNAFIERPQDACCRNRHLLGFHQSPFSWVAALISLGARPICLG